MINKLNVSLFLLLFSLNAHGDSSDSFQLKELAKKVSFLEESNRTLELKLNVYNEANNKLIEPTYALLALIIGLGIWNSIKSYRFDNQKIKLVEETVLNKVQESSKQIIQSHFSSEKSNIEITIHSIKEHLLRLKIFQAKLKCASIAERDYKDINVELFNLGSLLDVSKEFYEITRDHSEIKQTLNYILNYYKKYPNSLDYEKYETEMIRTKLRSINIEQVNDIKDLLLDLTAAK